MKELLEQWLRERNEMDDMYTQWSILDGDDFLIVDSWDTVKAINGWISEQGNKNYDDIDDVLGYDQWGFSDEYDTCSHCYGAIRTSPNSYCWTPDYWIDYDAGEYVCGDCTRSDFADDYLEYLVEKTAESEREQAVTVLYGSDLIEAGFTLVVEDCENGWHHGQADSPTAIVQWALEYGLDVLFTIRNSQFTITFDVYVRPDNEDDTLDVDGVKAALLDDNGYLLSNFREYPTPAMRMEAGLRKPAVVKVSGQDFIDADVVQYIIE